MHELKAFLLGTAALLLAGSQAAHAQVTEAPENKSTEKPDENDNDILVVGKREIGYNSTSQSSALFGERNILDTPFQVSSYSIEFLQDQQVRTLFDVSKNDASAGTGADSGGTGFYDSLSIRGFQLDNNNGYYRDGIAFANNAQMPFEDKAAVEVVKGLTGLRFGFSAPGGIVNYVLKRPTEKPYRFVDLFGDSNGTYGAHIDVGGKLSDDLGVRINGVVAHEAQFVNSVEGARQMISAFVTWNPAVGLAIEADAEYQNRTTRLGQDLRLNWFDPSLSYGQIKALLDRFDRRTFIGQNWTSYPTKSFIGSVRATYDFAPGWKVRLSAAQSTLQRDQIDTRPTSVQANGDYTAVVRYAPDQQIESRTFDAMVSGDFSTGAIKHNLIVGAIRTELTFRLPYPVSTVAGTSNIFTPVVLARPALSTGDTIYGENANQSALYASDYIELADWLNLFGGIRYTKPDYETYYDYANSKTPDSRYRQSAVTPTAGIVFKPRADVSIYANYAEGLESGGAAPSGTVNEGEILPPLKSKQYEAGVKADLFAGATFSSAIFEIDKSLEIIDSENRYVQNGRQVHRGFEASLAGNITKPLRVVASLLYLDAKMKKTEGGALDGYRPINVPSFKASAFASWRLPVRQDLSLNLGAFYSSKRYVDSLNTFAIDSYVRFDVGLRYDLDIAGTKGTVRVIVENLTNKNYFSGTSFGYLLYGAPRSAKISFSMHY